MRHAYVARIVATAFSMPGYKIGIKCENASDSWNILWYTTRKRCITNHGISLSILHPKSARLSTTIRNDINPTLLTSFHLSWHEIFTKAM